MKDILHRVSMLYDIADMVAVEVESLTGTQEVQRKINNALLQIEQAHEILESIVEVQQKLEIENLYKFIEHGGEEHRKWLREALFCFFEDRVKPPYQA